MDYTWHESLSHCKIGVLFGWLVVLYKVADALTLIFPLNACRCMSMCMCLTRDFASYRVIATKKDVNECEEGLLEGSHYVAACPKSGQQCINTEGSYRCNCKQGFQKTRDGECVGKFYLLITTKLAVNNLPLQFFVCLFSKFGRSENSLLGKWPWTMPNWKHGIPLHFF